MTTPRRANYDAFKEKARQRQRDMSAKGRDIAPLPPVVNSARKQRALKDFRYFCESYCPHKFTMEWSPDHIRVIQQIQTVVYHGGTFAMAMPRGSGKTTLCESATIWAALTGLHRFMFLVGSSEDRADSMLENIKTELAHNDLLLQDFPAVCYPIRRLEGETRRCLGQTYYGRQTGIRWGTGEIKIATIPGSPSSGAIIRVAGITGAIRGALHALPTGEQIRPSLAIIDDPQTDQSAKSVTQCEERERTLTGAILNLAGPGKSIAAIMPCTVIRGGDLADVMLDRDKHPEWQGERCKLVYAWPNATELWDQYAEVRRAAMRDHGTIAANAASCEFYRAHRSEMDAGASVAWPDRFGTGELSAIQHAMNLRIDRGDRVFFSEYQNEPLAEDGVEESVTFDTIIERVNGLHRGVVPNECSRLTMFVDIQKKALYWIVVGWADNFTGHVIDYGTYPDQGLAYYSLSDLRHTLQVKFPGAGVEAATEQGLRELATHVMGKEWLGETGQPYRIDRILIDANWEETTDAVFRFCRASNLPVTPSFGRPVGIASVPFSEYKRKPGERVGLNWRMGVNAQRRRRVIYDANFWKTFVYTRLAVPHGDPSSLGLFGKGRVDHRALCEHWTSERRTRAEARGRIVDQWTLLPGRDNHWFDGIVGCAVAASIEGCDVIAPVAKKERAAAASPTPQRRGAGGRVSLDDLRKRVA